MQTISIKLFKVNMEQILLKLKLYDGKGKNKSFCERASRKV